MSSNKFDTIFNGKKDILIYTGMIINDFPFGIGSGWNLWGTRSINLTGVWRDGYLNKKIKIFEEDKNFEKICSIQSKLFNKYKKNNLEYKKKYIYEGLQEMMDNLSYNFHNINENIIKINIKT
tara:strand:- start:677 stop:1045 length:369 start_codon:yes stop_codon:yes gene_type:complete